ncbi:outer membrane beta-barrel protein [Flammeovirga kamogawensis]|uniref:Outer membrane beta-barrel protein n=1 Tax=Flammeovirga kamogawensis TaxID=373891 RepID=A0ABX8GUP0_9BACT|nr:outer membrane beta-barrel protein [Flammeovirga kamogawensis]MBB6459820.1 outer membrane protein W [Flammeovirga kamogawensis]QWG07124.1 outer membrane beta-barrel protein [Flammeovirga kamogawensis]TRX68946.1 outer membrane beta-barrel protein [Flammeovirga kamogawensis]
MKKSIFILLFTFFSVNIFAQNKLVSIGVGGGATFMSTNVTLEHGPLKSDAVGGNYFFNGFFNVTPKLSLGVEYEKALGLLTHDNNTISNERTKVNNFSFKMKYYLTETKIRPYVGFGVGRYTFIPGKYEIDPMKLITTNNLSSLSVTEDQKSSAVGYVPEIGLDLAFFQLAVLYHIVPEFELTKGNKKFDTEYKSLEFRASINIGLISR